MKAAAVFVLVLLVALASGATVPARQASQRIVGGSATTIEEYPYAVAMLFNQPPSSAFNQWCGGSLLTSRAILSAAHCYHDSRGLWDPVTRWRARAGSTTASFGGSFASLRFYTFNPNYSVQTGDSDIIVFQTNSAFTFSSSLQPGSIAGQNYALPDNAPVWAIGWGDIFTNGPSSDTLRHVQIWTISQAICRQRYGSRITDNMLCSGWLDVGGRDQCQGDSGGPLIHNNVIVGVCSNGMDCGSPYYPGVNTRVSAFSNWIVEAVNNLP